MRTSMRFTLAALAAALVASCGEPAVPSFSLAPPNGPIAPSTGIVSFSAFVKDLIRNQTTATAQPVQVDGRLFGESGADPATYDDLFE